MKDKTTVLCEALSRLSDMLLRHEGYPAFAAAIRAELDAVYEAGYGAGVEGGLEGAIEVVEYMGRKIGGVQ